jgi:hypothetical protein
VHGVVRMSVVALVVAVIAVVIALGSLYFTWQANKARVRAEKAAPLHRLGTLVRDVAAAQTAAGSPGGGPRDLGNEHRRRRTLARLRRDGRESPQRPNRDVSYAAPER